MWGGKSGFLAVQEQALYFYLPKRAIVISSGSVDTEIERENGNNKVTRSSSST